LRLRVGENRPGQGTAVTWQAARVTMPTAWQLEQKMPVWREKEN
jgi:hypothetical protein